MNPLVNDIKYALRQLAKSPGTTVLMVMILSLGIGANTTLFSVLHKVLLEPLPFASAQRLMSVSMVSPEGRDCSATGPDYLDWVEQSQTFDELCGAWFVRLNLTGRDEPLALAGWQVTDNFFDTFEKPLLLGHGFSSSTGAQETILSYKLWQDSFAGNPEIIGKQIILDDQPYSITGIADPAYERIAIYPAQFFVPFLVADLMQERGNHYLKVFGRLASGVSIAQAQMEMKAIAKRLEIQYAATNRDWGVKIVPLHERIVGNMGMSIWVLYGAVTLILLIACINVSGLLLAKSGCRQREMGIRSALGATYIRILCQLQTESLCLAAIGGVLGMVLAHAGITLVNIIMPTLIDTSSLLGVSGIRVNGLILGFGISLSILTGMAVGLVPAWRLARVNLNDAIKEGTRSILGARLHQRFLHAFVTAEIALAMIVLIGAGLLLRSFNKLQDVNPGFNASEVLCLEMYRSTGNNLERAEFYQTILQKIRTIQGVESAGCVNLHPLSPSNSNHTFTLEQQTSQSLGKKPVAEIRNISADYFSTMQIPLNRGRFFDERDNRDRHTLIVNQEFVRQYLPNVSSLGRRICMNDRSYEIVGVVGNVISVDLMTRARPFMYEFIRQDCSRQMTIMVRAAGAPLTYANVIRQAIWSVDEDQPILRIQALRQLVGNTIAVQQLSAGVFSAIAGLALVLVVVGLYETMTHAVNERIREIGMRMAMGAQKSDILKLVIKKGMSMIAIGLLLGLTGAFFSTRIMSCMLYQVSSTDVASYIYVSLLLMAVALLACYLPARRAAKIDPMKALRFE